MVDFQSHTLDNGLQVIAEVNPQAHSMAAGFFVQTGARDESDAEAGVSHFLEHMAFKGSATRTADDVNRALDAIGADHNAWTNEENTVFHAAVLPEFQTRTEAAVLRLLSEEYGADQVILKRTDFVGPRLSGSLARQSIWLIVVPSSPAGRGVTLAGRSVADR